MLELAHFTPTELPGTAAIWTSGLALGLALASRASRAVMAALALIAALTVAGMLGDSAGWAEPVSVALDAAFLTVAVALILGLARFNRAAARTRGAARSGARSPRRRSRSGGRPTPSRGSCPR